MAGSSENPQLASKAPVARRWRLTVFLLVLVLVVAVANLAVRMGSPRRSRVSRHQKTAEKAQLEAPAQLSFDGSSGNLKNTVVLPSLESSVPAGKSAIWCATLAMAWQQMEKEIYKQRIDFEDEKLGRELSDTPLPALEPEHYYVAAGYVKDGIADRIRREMAAKFPKTALPDISPTDGLRAAIAFAYLHAAVLYKFQFKHNAEALSFVDSGGRQTPVHAFGIRDKDKNKGVDYYRGQVEILFRKGSTFALDLSRETTPYQVMVARLERKDNLKAMLVELEQRPAEYKAKEGRIRLGDESVMLVPSMNWRVEHEFAELRGKHVLNPAFRDDYLQSALGLVQFRFNRKGAVVESYTRGDWNNGHEAGPNASCIFDGPFLILLRTRAERRPFFAMWVDNAELLQRHD